VKAKLLTAVLAGAVFVSGCATVPTQGPIRSGNQEGLAPPAPAIGVEAQPPRDNAGPLAIVNGFLEAMADSQAFETARKYMTPEAAAAWKPESKISIYDQTSTGAVTPRGEDKVVLRAPLVGTVDQRGSWSPARNATVAFEFKLTKVNGQYRVAVAPPGVFIGSNQLETKLKPMALFYFTPDRSMLVPDPIYVPNDLPSGQIATLLIQQLLKGPTARLGNGVFSAAPPGTQVNVSVPVDLGVATVALSDTVATLTEADRTLLSAQIAWTLRLISSRVRITVGGAPLIADQEVQSFTSFSQYDPTVPIPQMKDLYGVRGNKIYRISLDGSGPIEPKPLDDSQLYPYSAQSLAVDLRGDFGAVVTRDNGRPVVAYGRLEIKEDNDKVVTIPTDGEVLRPTFDNAGNLWILDRADSNAPRLRMRAKDGKVIEVRTDFKGSRPTVLRMAPDGVRALLVLEKKTGETIVQTGAVTTNEAKQPVLSQLRSLELSLLDITDVSWAQAGILVTGKQAADSPRQPWQVNADGSQPRQIPGATNFEAVTVVSNSNVDTLPVVKDNQGHLHWLNKDLGWGDLGDDPGPAVDPVYPG